MSNVSQAELLKRIQNLEERIEKIESMQKPVGLRYPVKATSAPQKSQMSTFTPVEVALKSSIKPI